MSLSTSAEESEQASSNFLHTAEDADEQEGVLCCTALCCTALRCMLFSLIEPFIHTYPMHRTAPDSQLTETH